MYVTHKVSGQVNCMKPLSVILSTKTLDTVFTRNLWCSQDYQGCIALLALSVRVGDVSRVPVLVMKKVKGARTTLIVTQDFTVLLPVLVVWKCLHVKP